MSAVSLPDLNIYIPNITIITAVRKIGVILIKFKFETLKV